MSDVTTFQEALANYEAAYTAFFDVIADYPEALQEQSGAYGAWSPTQVLAYLCGWLVEGQRRYKRFPRGTGQITYNADVFNDVVIWERRDRTWDQNLAELQREYNALRQLAQSVTEHQINRDERYEKWLLDMAHKARTHSDDLKRFRDG